jgi:hypothetical protein
MFLFNAVSQIIKPQHSRGFIKSLNESLSHKIHFAIAFCKILIRIIIFVGELIH